MIEMIELKNSDIVQINNKRYKVMKKLGKKPWLKRIYYKKEQVI